MKFVVIGASRGLGLSLTEELLKAGHSVVSISRSRVPALAELVDSYPKLDVIEGDISQEDDMIEAAAFTKRELGEIDALCVVAGVLLDGDRVNRLHDADIAEVRLTFDVNVVGPIIAAKHFTPVMRDGGKFFVVTSEGVGITQCGTWVPAYGLSKTAATKAVGILNASVERVDYFAVHPGRMNTDMGRTTAQIEAVEAATGFVHLMDGSTPITREHWYIDYEGSPLEA